MILRQAQDERTLYSDKNPTPLMLSLSKHARNVSPMLAQS